jgi:hypothetical protein
MRLSSEKAANANMDGDACRKSGSPIFSVPRTLGRTWGTPRVTQKVAFTAVVCIDDLKSA